MTEFMQQNELHLHFSQTIRHIQIHSGIYPSLLSLTDLCGFLIIVTMGGTHIRIPLEGIKSFKANFACFFQHRGKESRIMRDS